MRPSRHQKHPKITMQEVRGLVGKDDPIVLEIGCNDGNDSEEFLATFPGITLYAFEPDPRPIRRMFRMHINRKDPRFKLHKMAVGAIDGTATFHQSEGMPSKPAPGLGHLKEWDLSGSLHKPTGHLAYSPWCKFDKTIEVPVIRLDTWLLSHPDIHQIDFIWADTQGAEVDLIEGGREALTRTRYLYTEYYERPMYEGQRGLEALLNLLGPDWEFMGIYDDNFLARNRNPK